MFFPKLYYLNIYPIGVGDYWGVEESRVFLVYSPLNGHFSLASPQMVKEMEVYVNGASDDKTQEKMFNLFLSKGSFPIHHLPKTPHDLYQIDILTNYTCNFNCIYCYSSVGRSNQQVDFRCIKAVVDYLFCSGKKQENPYIINFSGGGEPLLSFSLIKQTIEYIKQVNRGRGYYYNIGVVTNGSVITPEIIDFFQENNVNMAVSFEILKRFQDKERGSYYRVVSNLDMMSLRNFSFGIRTTFTPESVLYMCEMIEEMAHRFPKIKKVVFDVVLAPNLFPNPETLKDYYDSFLEEYYKAKTLATQYGIVLESVATETLSMVRDRTCEGKIVLTPVGSISSCARVSSPKEEKYNDYLFGTTNDGTLFFDENRFSNIINHNNIYSQPMCHDCFAKWNCGGGCRLFHDSFDERFEKVRCEFMRKALKRELLEVIGKSFYQAKGKDLKEYITNKIKQNVL